MIKKLSFSAGALGIFAALMMLIATPVWAHHNDGHDGGGSKSAGTDERTDERRDCDQNKDVREDHYDASCEPRESENGSKTGDGSGKPCAGCVGRADNKNPPGQEPDANGEDHNKGYECDDNAGISARRGSGNPAHTGCARNTTTQTSPTPSPTPTEPCDADPQMAGIQTCEKTGGRRVCDADPTMDGIQECEKPLCPEDTTMGATEAEDCVPPCPEDETMGDAAAEECLPPCPEDSRMGDVAAEECAEVLPRTVCDKDPTMAGVQECGDEVEGRLLGRATRGGPTVEGAAQEPGVLPFTGAGTDKWVVLGLLLMALGYLLSRPNYLVSGRG